MKKEYFFLILACTLIRAPFIASSQCTPVNCMDQLPPYGGVCNKSVQSGKVNQDYYDFASFHITSDCVDAGKWDSAYSGVGAKMLKLHTFSFSGLPAGLTITTNQIDYSAPANGCAGISGKPAEAGLFKVKLSALVNVRTWLISSNCSGFLYLDVKNQLFEGSFSMLILPDATFSGPDTNCCIQDPPVILTPSGTTGGTFSGPGVSGNRFHPSLAGAGIHQIKYEVTAQQGSAIGSARNSSVLTVKVYDLKTFFADNDKDGFGNPLVTMKGCASPTGFVDNDLDCNDSNSAIHPNAPEIPENGIDEDCNGSDAKPSAIHITQRGKFRWYPNPVHDFLIVESASMRGKADISIYSLNGLLLVKQPVLEQSVKIDVSVLPQGIYMVLLTNNEGSMVMKMVKE